MSRVALNGTNEIQSFQTLHLLTFVMGYLKTHVYRDRTTSLAHLKDPICNYISEITTEVLFNAAMQGLVHHLTMYSRQVNGGHHSGNL